MSHPLPPLRLPAAPDEPPPAGFPLITCVAPLAAAAVIWGLTGSVFALVFAGLSPVMALASLLDGRRTRRRARRRGAADHDKALDELRGLAQERQVLLRTERWERTPSATSILAAHDRTAYWPSHGVTEVSLGSGAIDGGLRVDGADSTPAHRALSAEIATLTEAPIVVDASHGIGVVGSLPLARALARSIVIQLSTALPPTRCGFGAPPDGWEWASALPHADSAPTERELAVWENDARATEGSEEQGAAGGPKLEGRLLIAVASRITELPPGCGTIVQVSGPDRAEIVRSSEQPRGLQFQPELVATAEAGRFAAILRRHAQISGLLPTQITLPPTVSFDSLEQQPSMRDAPGLACVIGRGLRSETSIDLVRDGPHAVVGGTTGSGKSELLVTWILAMAAIRTVRQVNFLLVDFKGGSSFGPLVALPHCVGLVTDLNAGEAARALDSLRAELRHRERILRDAQARDIDDLRNCPVARLVIVVDEFATMLDTFPDLHALFVDIGARGRSLGVHLVLCTQRPAGAVRDALLANCSLRISLRVTNAADSLALVGTGAAAELSPSLPGRAIVDRGDGRAALCQIATTNQTDLAGIVAAQRADSSRDASEDAPARRPWLEPLPAQLTSALLHRLVGAAADASATAGSLALGLLDEPEHQRYRVAQYVPAADGHLLVFGAPRSGKSATLALIEREAVRAGIAVERVGADVERAWDLLESAHRRSEQQEHGAGRPGEGLGRGASGDTPTLLLLFDDFDSVLTRWEAEHRLAALDLLADVLRSGATAGITCVVSAQRLANGLQLLSTLCQSRLLLRAASREDYLAAGGVPERFDPALPPGGGVWRERRIQLLVSTEPDQRRGEVAAPEPTKPAATSALSAGARADVAFPLACSGALSDNLIVVAGRPALTAERFRRLGLDGPSVVELTGTSTGSERLEISRAATATVFVGDAEAWQGEWGLLHSLRPQGTMIFDGCSLADFRQLSRRRQLPPPLAPVRGRVWVLGPDGEVERGSLPEPLGR